MANEIEKKEIEKKVEGQSNKVVAKTAGEKTSSDKDAQTNKQKRGNFKRQGFNKRRPVSEFEEKLINLSRVTNVTKGGRTFSFSAVVVIGNKKGKVAWGSGKAREVPDAIKKAIKDAKRRIVQVPIIDGRTVPHIQQSKFLASKVLIKPAPKGKGIIASGSIRAVVELAGYKDIYTKSLGSRSKTNAIKATIKALSELRTIEQIAAVRGLKPSQILNA